MLAPALTSIVIKWFCAPDQREAFLVINEGTFNISIKIVFFFFSGEIQVLW